MCPAVDRSARRRRFGDRSGFTLIEVLVACAVMATILGVLYRSVVQTRAGAQVSIARQQQEIVARSLLGDYAARRSLRDGSYSGDRDGDRWTLRATTIDLGAQMLVPPTDDKSGRVPDRSSGGTKSIWVPQRLTVKIATVGRPVEAETVHLVARPQEGDAR